MMTMRIELSAVAALCLLGGLTGGAKPASGAGAELGAELERTGDEIVVCGRFFHTTAPVVLWMDPGGYDAYRVEKRFGPMEKAPWAEIIKDNSGFGSPNRYGLRIEGISPEVLERVRGGGWDLPTLQKTVDQFVIHYDVCGVSQTCYRVLHDERDLSVQFMLDVDGTIYQTLDLKDKAQHATIANSRSVGVEIAHIGAYPPNDKAPLERWYATGPKGVVLKPPRPFGELGVKTKGFVGQPDRQELIEGNIQGQDLVQYDFTPEQYDSLIKLTATLCTVFPRLKCTYPTEDGKLIPRRLEGAAWKSFHGVLGHYHVQANKTDPGPAFNWEKVIGGAKQLIE
jgi:N-acetylmuramoyl-L-alanine amidase